ISARSPITLRLPEPVLSLILPPRMTPTTPVRPMPVTTSSQPNALSLSATEAAVRWTSYCSSGWAWMSCRHAAISACRSARRLTSGILIFSCGPSRGKFTRLVRGLARAAQLFDALLTGSRPPPTHPAQERVAQLVEHLTFNQVVLGSSPSALTKNHGDR